MTDCPVINQGITCYSVDCPIHGPAIMAVLGAPAKIASEPILLFIVITERLGMAGMQTDESGPFYSRETAELAAANALYGGAYSAKIHQRMANSKELATNTVLVTYD